MSEYVLKDQGYYLSHRSVTGKLDEWSPRQCDAVRFGTREAAVNAMHIRVQNMSSYPTLVRICSTSRSTTPEEP